jgi:hypothetical protein
MLVLLLSISFPFHMSIEWLGGLSHLALEPRPMGDINPSALGLADWAASTLELPPASVPALVFAFYLSYCVALLLLSLTALVRARASGSRQEQAVLAVLLWLLLSPRVMVYSYVMAIVPALYVVQNRIRSGFLRSAATFLLVFEGLVRFLPGRPPSWLGPMSFAILVGAWALWVWGDKPQQRSVIS